jgi:Zn-dependent protease with chaperone function
MFKSRIYRHNNEGIILFLTIQLIAAVIIITSTVTFCLSGVFIIAIFILSAMMIRSHHQSLMHHALAVDDIKTPELSHLVDESAVKLQPGEVDVFLVNQNQMNAYTFGVGDPKVLVLYRPLLHAMSPRELQFVIGHEMGHVALGHTWVNTIVGGLAGIPAPFGAAVLLYAAFRWWNRMCEYSADRAGLLACGSLPAAIAALVKLVAPEVRSQKDFEKALAAIDAEDDLVSNRFLEVFQSHPMLIRRINKLKDYARTNEYRHLQANMNKNLQVARKPSSKSVEIPSENAVEPANPPQEQASRPLKPEERWPWLKPIERQDK